jgi:hypothetical protein
MSKTAKLEIVCDSSPLLLLIKHFNNALVGLKGPLNLLDLTLIETDNLSTATGELFVLLYPSDAFLRFATATLAGQFDLDIIQNFDHGDLQE